jgi:glycosyltransferase involved in cell wall biosynthesis
VDCLSKIDGLIPINRDELKHYERLGYRGPALTIPFGIDPQKYIPNHSTREAKTVFHLGSMDWKPNQEGIKWFLEKVWPLVTKENSELNLHLAGRNMPEWLTNYHGKQVKIDGEVDNALDYIKSKNIMIVPLMSGGGMRVKMVEALALEKPVVSTPIGANGVHVEDGFSAIIASQPRVMAKAILNLAADQDKADAMGKRGRELINDQYNTTKLSKELAAFLNNLES